MVLVLTSPEGGPQWEGSNLTLAREFQGITGYNTLQKYLNTYKRWYMTTLQDQC
jgi:hypothetical protein